jgi:hypothetical protein
MTPPKVNNPPITEMQYKKWSVTSKRTHTAEWSKVVNSRSVLLSQEYRGEVEQGYWDFGREKVEMLEMKNSVNQMRK